MNSGHDCPRCALTLDGVGFHIGEMTMGRAFHRLEVIRPELFEQSRLESEERTLDWWRLSILTRAYRHAILAGVPGWLEVPRS